MTISQDDVDAPIDVTASIRAIVGSVTAAWSLLGRTIDLVLCRICGLESELGLCLMSQIDAIPRKLSALEALLGAKHAGDLVIARVQQFRQRAESLSSEVRRVTHDSVYHRGNVPEHLAGLVLDERLLRASDLLSPDSIRATATEITKLIEDFVRWAEQTCPDTPMDRTAAR